MTSWAKYKVMVDASWKDGSAWIAMAGYMGERVECVAVDGNAHAELLAIRMAMRECLARANGERPRPLLILTDSTLLLQAKRVRGREAGKAWNEIKHNLARFGQWKVQHAPRRSVAAAHKLAGDARRQAEHGPLGGRS